MNPIKNQIHIVWLKRDLRLHDNEAIFKALKTDRKTNIAPILS